MKWDIISFTANSLTVDGYLRFDETIPNINQTTYFLKIKYLWVRGGTVIAGYPDTPFPGKIDI